MEAVTKHVFAATQDDDLGFDKGVIINVLDMDQDKNWFKAELNGEQGWVPKTYIEMRPHNWFHGKITRKQSESILMEKNGEGVFLVRDSESDPGEYSLSVKFAGQVQHFKIFRDAERKYFLWNKKFDSINKLIEFHKTNSVSRTQNILLRDAKDSMVATAMYGFAADEEGEVGFSKGDKVIVLDASNKDWWKGSANGQVGLFPASYVSID
ncbi:growth factor receptor-bound protein 2-like [Actinia tenebrosa]|uniref:Growth factor receptor-bound protein 2-like n=1 Tax=Actinia tenebrosa TaxID=6105 RepID=A0A6P8J319_ACTTE|nr:growth factor receptor-bound protein 2-like [Actinia tenebrosa]